MRTDVKNTLMYQRLQSAIGRKNLENIIANDNIITANGQIRHYNDDIEVKKTTLRYHNIGLKEFYDNYEEILEYFKTKRKDKVALIDQLIQDKAIVWTSKYPVYSSALRPEGINVESYFFSPLDKQINPLTNITINLKKASEIEIPLYLYQAQTRVNALWDLNFSLIDAKHGWIRANVLGGEYNFSNRSVIVLNPELHMDEVDMSYKQFLGQFKGHIVRRLIMEKGWTVTKASNYLASKFNFDEEIYQIMQRIVKEEHPRIIINRNPTITFGSILEMKVRKIKRDPDDVTLNKRGL